jgi:hypothetical protein
VSRARAVLATTPGQEAGGNRNALLAADRELAATEAALDQVYDLLRPGAERQADRRTRAAALNLAEARLDAVKGMLVSAGVPDAEKRIKIVRASFAPGDESSDDSGGVVLAMLLSKKKP